LGTIVLGLAVVLALIISVVGLKVAIGLCLFPLALLGLIKLVQQPSLGLFASLVLSFFISGLSRYLTFPWGLGIDILLFVTWLLVFLQQFRTGNWQLLKNDINLWLLLWFTYVCLQVINPEARSLTAWFYAMRGIGFYQLLSISLAFLLLRDPKYVRQFLYLSITLSVLGTLWGLRQKYLGTDAAEDHWLWVEGHWDEHILFGVLRVFSFYSDAGQFGASQAMFALICGILFLNPKATWSTRLLFLAAGLLTFFGFAISGTRGAMAVPVTGGVVFLVVSRNFRLLFTGLFIMGFSFYILKYTHVLHGVEQIRRMRTALADDNPSLSARLRNQATLGRYLQSRPIGGGIGTAGFWGNRFSPNSLLAQTPTDSYYVKVWAETGIIGLTLHLMMLAYFIGKAGFIVWHLKDINLRYQMMAIYAGFVGVLFCSYGNQVFSQMPTGMIMNMCIPLLFLAPYYDQLLTEQIDPS
jgi:hypothetical protein